MPISINLWVPTRGQSWDSCDHYKVVSSLQGIRLGPWGERMNSARIGTVFRDGCSLSSLLGGSARASSQSFICRRLLGINCHLLVAFCSLCPQSCGAQWCIFRAGREDVSGSRKWPENNTIANTKGKDQEGGGCQQVW